MKESLHKPSHDRSRGSTANETGADDDGENDAGRRIVHDVDAVRAMASPHRVAILSFLLSGPPRTATECAAEVGGSPSACSYHLRELERFGLVERVASSGDGRSRPWRAAAVGYSVGTDWIDESPAQRAAGLALSKAELVENQRLVKRFLEAGDRIDPSWRSASHFHTYELLLTPTELQELNDKIDGLVEAYRVPVRRDAPDDAAPVHVNYQAFPRVGPS